MDEQRLRLLDDALRQDVPGTDGWRWDETTFREQTFNPASFDAATYVVAVDEASGDYLALARVWSGPGSPRLGLVAVLPSHRRRGLARSLLGRVFAVLHDRGVRDVSAEVDDNNLASAALLTALGARRVGGIVEMRRDPPAAPVAGNGTARGSDTLRMLLRTWRRAAQVVLGGKPYRVNVMVGEHASKQTIAEALAVGRSFRLAG